MSHFVEKVKAKFVKRGRYWRVLYIYPSHSVIVKQKFNSVEEAHEYMEPTISLLTNPQVSGVMPIVTYCLNEDIGKYL